MKVHLMSWCRWKELVLIILNEQKQAKMIENDSIMIENDQKWLKMIENTVY